MPDTTENSKKTNRKKSSKKSQSKKRPPTQNSTTTASTTTSTTSPKINILKRPEKETPSESDSSKNPNSETKPLMEVKVEAPSGNMKPLMNPNNSTTSSPMKPLMGGWAANEGNSIKPLMDDPPPIIRVNALSCFTSTQLTTPEKSVAGRQAEANKNQRQTYYFSKNAGTAVSADTFQKSVQYKMKDFPLEKNVNILIDGKISLLITPTNNRCNGIYIRVKSQYHEDNIAMEALIKADSSDDVIRNACTETIKQFYMVSEKRPQDRYPFSESSEDFLSSCYIKKLDERLDAFPEAIYYCEKCDYHINTINHAKVHLESSTHFDDIQRQEQRHALLAKIPAPTTAHLNSINEVLKKILGEYKESFQVKTTGRERADRILFYLKTDVFPTIGTEDVQLKPFGSSTYDVVLPDSDYNVACTMDLPEGTPIFELLEKIRKKIADDGHPADHSIEMGSPSTIIFSFEDVKVRLCWMSCFKYRSQLHLSELMRIYVNLRPEVVGFLQLIRLWAVKAGVDSKNRARIGMPRYGFDLMAIHFLQQQNMLPVLHEMFEEEDGGEVVEQKKEEDEQENQPEEAGQRRIRLMSRYEKNLEKIGKKFDLTKPWNHAKLFIAFFRYYVDKNREVVIQITQKEPMSRNANRWNKKILHVVDPFRGDNVLSIPKVSMWQPYYFNCLLSTFVAFSIPRTENGPIVEVGFIHQKSTASKKKAKEPTKQRFEYPKPPMKEITEEEAYQKSADEVAEEQEHEAAMENLRNRQVIDGIKYLYRKPEDYEIDDHRNFMYSRRAMRRFRRTLETWPTEEIVDSLGKNSILKKREGLVRKLMRRRKEEKEKEKVEEIVEKMEKTLTIEEILKDVKFGDVVPQGGAVPVDQTDLEEVIVPQSGFVETVERTPEDDKNWPSINYSNSIIKSHQRILQSNNCPEPIYPKPSFGEFIDSKSEAPPPPSSTSSELKDSKKSTSTIAKNNENLSAEKPICTEEFFLKENIDSKELTEKAKNLNFRDFRYEFATEMFCGGYEMEMKCTHCDGNHCVENCPMMEIPPIQKFAPRSQQELQDIDNVIDKYYRENILSESRINALEEKKRELETFMRRHYRADVSLTIFGSVMTGLSVSCSDIDICLRIGEGDEPPKDLTARDVILKTEDVLRRCYLAKNVSAITTAKVPIVKFQLVISKTEKVDADISYYNILAIYNTDLLKEYTLWTPDHRFAKLALFVKRWAKFCDIGDASRGSLSSYAHVILLISYLQNCDPPVLPRLQEDFRNDSDDRRIVEKWDTSFSKCESKLQKNWQKNRESCAQLLVGYFDYYSRFDFRNFVIQCRREMTLSKMEKDWPRPLCVEDPFDLNHNLSSGVTKKMFVFIMKVFINSRAVFMSEKPALEGHRGPEFTTRFYTQLLRKCNQGSAPTDRQCHQCHRIGHFIESCPLRAQQREARRRHASNSTLSSYKSNNGFTNNSEDGGDRLMYHKRTYHRRSYN